MEEHFCKEHNTKFYRNEKEGKVWYSHKKKEGGYCNEPKEEVKETPAATPQSPVSTSAEIVAKTEMTKTDWAEKDRVTRKSIERQTALNAAVEISRGAENLTPSKITKIAKIFELYLDSGQIFEDIEIAQPVAAMNSQQQGIITKLHGQKGVDGNIQTEYFREKYKLADGQKMNFNNAKNYIEYLNTLPDKK